MGILADLFVATPPEAAVYEEILLRNIAVAESNTTRLIFAVSLT